MQPRVAVLLAAFNGKQWLKEQIDSILSQEGVMVSLYINVDQSSDGTEDFIDQLSKSESRIHTFTYGQHYGGAAANFYHLIKNINFNQYDHVALSDQDDIWLTKKLFTAIVSLNKCNADAYSSNITAFWPNGKKLFINKAQEQVKWDFLFEAAGPGCTYVLTKKFAINLQNFILINWGAVNRISLHDWLIYAYARANGYHWFIDPYSSLLYRQHANNQVGANVGLSAFLGRVKKVLNGWGLNQSLLIANAVGLGTSPFVSSWSKGNRLGYLSLTSHFWQCRRRLKDKFLFLMACISFVMLPPNNKQKEHLKVDA
ncbi:glycosyltransferase [Polynucleobacter hallstattensis]|uniref:glycosyltransferase n=1 Tax=Polynucleobacter hallstattensis TaxID=1855586 RepID=UPI001C0BC51B|nr:glycosyltransferase [Polynucleobacter hallstattensis]MBU3560610.1 glycosyltransferase [Polynucleobacter hallstattensis]